MRAVAVVAMISLGALGGCPSDDSGDGECHSDSACGTEVCARDGECAPASEVRMVVVTWTIDGMAANATTCASIPSLFLQFDGEAFEDSFAFAPVPCMQGQFTIDKIPDRFTQVELGVEGVFSQVAPIGSDGTASIDLSQ